MTGPTSFRPSGSEPESSGRPKLSISVWTGLLIVLAAALSFTRALNKGGEDGYAVSYAAGSLVGLLLLVLIVGGITFFLSKRSSKAANIAIMVVCVLAMLSIGAGSIRDRRARQNVVLDKLTIQSDQFREEQRAEFERTGSVSVSAERAEQALDQLSATAQEASNDEGKAVQVSVDVMRGLTALSKDYEAKIAEAQELGGLDGKGIATIADIDRRAQVWADAGRIAAQMTAKTAGIEKEVADGLVAAGIPERVRRPFMAGMTKGDRMVVLLDIRWQEEAIVAGVQDQLAVLKRSFGKWKFDEAQGTVVFEDDADLEAYNAAFAKVQAASEAQSRSQQQLLEIQTPGRK